MVTEQAVKMIKNAYIVSETPQDPEKMCFYESNEAIFMKKHAGHLKRFLQMNRKYIGDSSSVKHR